MNQHDTDSAVAGINAKIQEIQAELCLAQEAVKQIPVLTANVAALERARELLIGKPKPEILPELRKPASLIGMIERMQDDSISTLIVKVLTDAGESMTVQDVWANVQKDRPVSLKTLGSVMAQCLGKGLVRRTARATYAIPLAQNGGRLAGLPE